MNEGDLCPICGLGYLEYISINCSCHISPPCSSCVEAKLTCDKCKCNEDDIVDDMNEEKRLEDLLSISSEDFWGIS